MLKSRFNGRIYRVKAGKGTTHFARELRNVQSILNGPDSQLLSSSDDFEGVSLAFGLLCCSRSEQNLGLISTCHDLFSFVEA